MSDKKDAKAKPKAPADKKKAEDKSKKKPDGKPKAAAKSTAKKAVLQQKIYNCNAICHELHKSLERFAPHPLPPSVNAESTSNALEELTSSLSRIDRCKSSSSAGPGTNIDKFC